MVGNWQDENLLRDHNVGGRDRFDVVLADYLLGAAEEFWPYGADVMLGRSRTTKYELKGTREGRSAFDACLELLS